MSLRHRLLELLRRRFQDDPPSLALIFPDGDRFDFAPNPAIAITFRSPEALKALVRGDFARAADAYVDGQIVVDGPIETVLKVGIALAERLGRLTPGLTLLKKLIPVIQSRRSEAANIRHHYDVGNEFYRLWLDNRMIYSCAYFRTGREDIHTAQEQKLDHICRKLMLRPGDRLLDIGCGWGGLLDWAASKYGASGIGITLSEQQYSAAREAVLRSGLSDSVDIRFQNYRDFDDRLGFDKIVSVGMYEHVGLRHLPTYFGMVARLLRPGGIFLNHGIFSTDPDGHSRGPPGGEFIDRHVFPGGAVPHISRALIELRRAGLEFADVEDLRPHYALTLQHWSRRLEVCADQAIEAGGPEVFRIWRVFLAGMAYAFDHGWLSIAQVLSFKPSSTGEVQRPWTREYQYTQGGEAERMRSMRMAGKLDWT